MAEPKKKEDKEEDLESITEAEALTLIQDNISTLNDKISGFTGKINKLVRLYNKIELLKRDYHIEYYLVKESLSYNLTKKKPAGYKRYDERKSS